MNEIDTVGYENDDLLDKAQQLACQLNFRLDKNAPTCLFVSSGKVALKIPSFSLLAADFHMSTWNKRAMEGKKQGLIKACKPKAGLKIIDATAGWGRDSALLASFGAEVLMFERHPVMACLLEDALLRRNEADKQRLNLSLTPGNACLLLKQLSAADYPDVIYIDPMHPERTKSALVKKDMQVLQQMIGPDEDVLQLIILATQRARQRVVVKWPQKSQALLIADDSIEGKTVRFDIYFNKAHRVTHLR